LEGVVAATSAICFIDGNAGRLVYRGYEIPDLVENVTFEETAHLLWDGELPNKTQLAALKQDLAASMGLPPHVQQLLRALPKQMQPMDALRTAVSALGAGQILNETSDRGFLALQMGVQLVIAPDLIRLRREPVKAKPAEADESDHQQSCFYPVQRPAVFASRRMEQCGHLVALRVRWELGV